MIFHRAVLFEPPEPPLDRRGPAPHEGGQRQRGGQAGRGLHVAGLHPVLQCLAARPVVLVPLRGPPVQHGHQPGLQPVQLGQQHVPEQVVVAVPLPPPVQRHQQQVRPLQVRQHRSRPGLPEHRIAQRPAHPLQHRGPGQERPLPAGDPPQELRLHVLAHQPVIPAEGDRRARQRAALPQVQRCQVQPGRPPLGPLMQRRHVLLTQGQASVAQQRRRLPGGQRQVVPADLGDLALSAQPRDPQRRPGPAGEHQPRTGRHVIGQHRQRRPALPVPQHVHVIQHQHHRRGHRRKRRPQPPHDRAGHRTPPVGERVEHPLIDRLHRTKGLSDIGQQDLRVIIPLIHRHPREGLAVTLGPLRQQRRLPVTRRRHHRDDWVGSTPRQPFDQGRTTYGPRPDQRTTELGRDEVEHCPARIN